MRVLLLIAAMVLAAPAFAETASPAPPRLNAPVSKDSKTDFTKPFIYDGLKRQLPPEPVVPPPIPELKADPGSR